MLLLAERALLDPYGCIWCHLCTHEMSLWLPHKGKEGTARAGSQTEMRQKIPSAEKTLFATTCVSSSRLNYSHRFWGWVRTALQIFLSKPLHTVCCFPFSAPISWLGAWGGAHS